MPYAFTEQGVAMLSAVLKSETAIRVSIQIMDAFSAMRRALASIAPILSRLDVVERRQITDQQRNEERFDTIFKAMDGGDFPPQKVFFDGKFMGSEPGSGVVLPSFEKLANAYGLPYRKLSNNKELDAKLPEIFSIKGAVLIEVMLDPFEVLGPKAASKRLPDGTMVSAPLEDMAPFLPREELNENMIIPTIDSF